MTPPQLSKADADALAALLQWLTDHPDAEFSLEGRPGAWYATLDPWNPPRESYEFLHDALRKALEDVTI